MLTTTLRHNLSNVDLEHRTATCSVCGETPVFVDHTPKRHKLVVGCLTKRRIDNRAAQRRKGERRRLANPNWKPKHKVRQLNPETLTGVCDICGPTEVIRYGRKRITYICANKAAATARKVCAEDHVYKPWVRKPSFVLVSQLDQMEIINEHKLAHGCTRCGYNGDPLNLELHFWHLEEGEFTVSKLVCFRRKRLLHALKICEVYCVDCHPLMHREPISNEQSPHLLLPRSQDDSYSEAK
jgi:hypothetical protein